MASAGAQPAAGGTAGDEPTTSGPVGCKGPISSAVAVAVGVATLLILVASVAFGALHRGDETGQVLDFRDVRRSNLGGQGPDLGAPELVYGSVLWGAEGKVDLVVQASHGYQAQAARDNGLEGHLGRISLQPSRSREAHFNFSFRAAGGGAGGARTQVQRFFFTVFLTSSGELVRVSNFSRLCWDIDAKFERHRRRSGQDVLLLAPPRMEALTPKDLRGLEERRHAATFFFESAESFSVSVLTKGDDRSNMDFFFSGQNVVDDLCEDRGKVTSGMSVEVVRGAYSGFRGTARLSGKQLKIILANGTALEVEPADCNIIREDLHAIREEWRDEKSVGSSTCAGLYDAELACSQDGCSVIVAPESFLSCDAYCQAHNMHCHKAWRTRRGQCRHEEVVDCRYGMPTAQQLRGNERLLCRCQPLARSRLGQEVVAGSRVMLLSGSHRGAAGAAEASPSRGGHVEVHVQELLTLQKESFSRIRDGRSVSCDELHMGEDVEISAGSHKGQRGAVLKCDPVSERFSVSLERALKVSAFDVEVLSCARAGAIPDVAKNCSVDHCKMEARHPASCHDHCHSQGLQCLRAWRRGDDRCKEEGLLPCDHHRGGDKICECVPQVRPDLCFQKGLTFRPLNMRKQGRSQEPEALSCQRRCAKVFGCAHFSYWTDGGCHLQDEEAKLEGSDGVISGPASCLLQPAHRGAGGCLTEGVSYDPLDMKGQSRTSGSLAKCQQRCAGVSGCVHFSFWSDGGCHLQDARAVAKGSPGAMSGRPNCHLEVPAGSKRPGLLAVENRSGVGSRGGQGSACASLVDVQHHCQAAHGCKVVVARMARRSCEVYCEDEGLSCIGAWEGQACGTSKPMDCDRLTGSATMTCHCVHRQGSKESQQHAHERHRHGKAAESGEEEDSWGFHCRGSDIEAWSEEKRWWCCRELEVGCETTSSKSFSCDPSDDFEMWEEDKQRFCCREEGLCTEDWGSEHGDSEDGESEDAESAMLERETSDEDGESYDCEQLLYQEAEAFEAMDWCCSHRGIGCRQTQRCDAEVSWSSDDRRWCCEHEGLGCDELQARIARLARPGFSLHF
ncbi:ANK1 [Symbiodinium sp. CCMP2592]|nr:ANK1 [Symbiodinium sp. CCMP2592]